MLYEAQTYASYQTPGQHSTPGVKAESGRRPPASPQFVVGTPGRGARAPRAGARRRQHHVQPARRWPAARPRMGEPRALRVRGVAASAVALARSVITRARRPESAPVWPLVGLGNGGYRRSRSPEEVGNGPVPPLRQPRAPSPMTVPDVIEGVRLRREGLRQRDELARARARRARAAVASTTGATVCATRSPRCTTCGRVTSSRPKRPARSSTSSSARRRDSRRPRLACVVSTTRSSA